MQGKELRVIETDEYVLSQAIKAIDAAQTKPALLISLKDYLARFGATHIGIGQLINPAMATKPISHYGVTDFPKAFTQAWYDEKLIMHDPIARYAIQTNNVFKWSEARVHATKFGLKMMDMASELSMASGLAVPIVIPDMPRGVATIAHPNPEFSEAEILNIELACIHAYIRLSSILDTPSSRHTKPLTQRETEILHYLAGGKTNWEISKILDISVETVKVHTKNIMRKLNAVNRAHAVTIGLKQGAIIL